MSTTDAQPIHTSQSLNVSISSARVKQTMDMKKDFDKRVVALNKEFQELTRSGKGVIDKFELGAFFERHGVVNSQKIETVFQELDENNDGQITKYFLYINFY